MFKHELYKLLFNKASAAVMAIILVVNVLQLVWLENNRYYYPVSAYNELWNDLKTQAGDSGKEWNRVLEELKEEYQKMREADIMEAAGYKAEYTGYLFHEMDLYERVIAEIESTLGYEEYLAGIEAMKSRFDAMGSLVKKDNYVYRNLVKTADVYANLTEIELIPSASAGITMAVGSDITDFLGIVLFLFFGITAWLKEKEQGVLVLIRTARNGRFKLAVTKMAALVTVCSVCGAMLYVSNIVAAGITYGLGDVTRELAAVNEYRATLWRISVWEFLLLNLLVKLVAYIWLALLISVVCTGVKTSVAAFGGIALLCAGSYGFYTGIPALSAFAVIKYLNPFGIIKTQLIFQEFRGLNIFGYPFDYRKCVTVVLVAGCVLFAFLTARLFVRPPVKSGIHMPVFVGKFSNGYIKIRRRFEGHVSITGHELYRIFISGGILVVIVTALVLQVASKQPYTVRYMNLSGYYERQYLETLSGAVTEEKKIYLESERNRLKKPADDNEQEQKKAVNAVISRLSYLEENEGTYFIYDEPFGLVTAAKSNYADIAQTVFFMVLLALSMPAFFAPEWQTGMRKVVSVTMHGKCKLVRVRYITGAILAAVLLLVSYLPPFLQIMFSYEVEADLFSYPAGSLMHLSDYGANMSIGTYLFIVGTLRYAAGMLATFFVYKISALIKSQIYTMAVAFGVLLIPALLAMLDRELEFVMYPYSAFAGNMAMQSGVAMVTFVITMVVATAVMWAVMRKKAQK